MSTGWIKLHRKIIDSEVFSDQSAFYVFMWILCNVDHKTGTMKTGRNLASAILDIKPRTFHKILTERLCDRYKLVTLNSDNKKTIISVKNWNKYQSKSDIKVTSKGQQSDTIQEYKNKEINIYAEFENVIQYWNEHFGRRLKPREDVFRNYEQWIKAGYKPRMLKLAVHIANTETFWWNKKSKLDPELFFRQYDRSKQPVNYVQQALDGYESKYIEKIKEIENDN